MQYKQFILDELMSDELAEKVENDVIDNLRASLAADDDPSNGDHEILITRGVRADASGRTGTYIIGTVDAEPEPYPEASHEEYEISEAKPTKYMDNAPTDFNIDDDGYLTHMLGKVQD